jgi:hypothetical protein
MTAPAAWNNNVAKTPILFGSGKAPSSIAERGNDGGALPPFMRLPAFSGAGAWQIEPIWVAYGRTIYMVETSAVNVALTGQVLIREIP